MTEWVHPFPPGTELPDHTQLPESDGSFARSLLEHPQSVLLTESIQPVLRRRHPDGRYAIGQDCGIYWRITEPPERGSVAPDWFYVPDVPPLLAGQVRRSYVMWQEWLAPLIVMEFVSGDGTEERDRTPITGKYWIYERAIRASFYAIYDVRLAQVELYELVGGSFQPVPANERGHYPVAPLGVELGIWQGTYLEAALPWMRWWDSEGNLLLTSEERAEQERQRAEQERQRAEQERQRAEQQQQLADQQQQRAERLAARLREMGIDPDAS